MNTLATMLKIFTILAALIGSGECAIVSVPQNSVETTVGGNITLLCTYRMGPDVSNWLFQWTFYSPSEKEITLVYFSQQGQSYSYGQFRDRIQGANRRGNASITIFNMQPSDTGAYTCEVFNPLGPNGMNEKSVAVSVLVPPSQPSCSLCGTPKVGHFISLFCFSKEGLPAPTYQWQKVSGDTVIPVMEPYNPQTGVLIIGNWTDFDQGYYRCVATNSLGRKSCQIDLTNVRS